MFERSGALQRDILEYERLHATLIELAAWSAGKGSVGSAKELFEALTTPECEAADQPRKAG